MPEDREVCRQIQVLQLVNTLDVKDGGPPVAVHSLQDIFMERSIGSRIFVVASSNSHSKVLGFGRRAQETVGSLLKVRKLICDADVVLIHGYYLYWIPVLALLAYSLKVPTALSPHGSLSRRQRQFSRRKKFIFDLLLGRLTRRAVDIFVVGSTQEARELEEIFPGLEIAIGGLAMPIPIPSASVHSTWLSKPHVINLLSVSRIAPKKRIDVCIKTVQLLQSRGFGCTLTVAGEGHIDIVNKLKDLARSLGVEESVFFVGWVGDDGKVALYRNATFFILPSEDENFGIAPMEALAHGVPVMLTSAVASAEFVNEEVGTVLSRPDAGLFAEAVEEFLKAGVSHRTQEAARRVAEGAVSRTSVGKRWEDILRKAIQDEHSVGCSMLFRQRIGNGMSLNYIAIVRAWRRTLKKNLPQFVTFAVRRVEQRLLEGLNKGRSSEQIFTRIYEKKSWSAEGGKFNSGLGSTKLSVVDPYVELVFTEVDKAGAHGSTFVDLGCGDFEVGVRLRELAGRYVGVDVVRSLIARNSSLYGRADTEFVQGDIVSDDIPDGRVCFIRQVLQHLSNDQIAIVLDKLKKFELVFITEHQPSDSSRGIKNVDKAPGGGIRLYRGSGVYLDQPPFNIPSQELTLLLEVEGTDGPAHTDWGCIRTFLWKPSSKTKV